MVNEKQCYKQFCKITDGKENEGYIEWKEWVLEQVKVQFTRDYTG